MTLMHNMSVHLCGWYESTRQIIHYINTHMSVHLCGWYGSTRQIIHDINTQYECTLNIQIVWCTIYINVYFYYIL